MTKLAQIIFSCLFSLHLLAAQTYTIHYLGDAKPIVLEVPTITNKGGNGPIVQNAKIILNFDSNTTLGLNADFKISIDGEKVSIEGNSINRSIIEVNKNIIDDHNIIANIKFIPSETILAPIKNGITELKLTGNQLEFVTGNLSDESLFNLNLKIERRRLFKSDSVLIDRKMTKDDITTEVINETQTRVHIDLDKITNGKFSDANKVEVTVRMNLTYNFENVVNIKQLGNITFTRSNIFQKTNN